MLGTGQETTKSISYGEDLGKGNSGCCGEGLKPCLDTSSLYLHRRKVLISWEKDSEVCHSQNTDKYLSTLVKGKQTNKTASFLGEGADKTS